MASAFEIFSRAERVERASSELYALVAECFPWPAEDGALLRRLAEEEVQHAARIRLLAARYRSDARAFAVETDALAGLERTEQALGALRSEISAGRWASDLPGLKDRLANLEEGSHGSHADLLARASDPAVGAFFRALASQDRAHVAMLRGSPAPAANG